MNLPSTHDQLNRFIFDDLAVRGEIVQLHDVYTELFHSKKYPLSIKKILAQLTMVCNLLTVNMKIEGDVTVEIRGDGLREDVRGVVALRLLQFQEGPAAEALRHDADGAGLRVLHGLLDAGDASDGKEIVGGGVFGFDPALGQEKNDHIAGDGSLAGILRNIALQLEIDVV